MCWIKVVFNAVSLARVIPFLISLAQYAQKHPELFQQAQNALEVMQRVWPQPVATPVVKPLVVADPVSPLPVDEVK